MSLTIEVVHLPAPVLEFGGGGAATDPKIGLAEEGPFSLRFGSAHQDRVRVGIVGPDSMVDLGTSWFMRCQHPIASEADIQARYPDFPGFRHTFRSSLDLGDRWQIRFTEQEVKRCLDLSPSTRFNAIVDLYAGAIEQLSNLEVHPDVIVCCIPEEIIRTCRTVTNQALSHTERSRLKAQARQQVTGQLSLFETEWDADAAPEDLLYRDLRRALKARAMELRMPIQIGTENLFLDDQASQDPATRAWNVSVALFYKSGGIPWRLRTDGPETCFVGISFHHLKTTHRHHVYSSLAQAFSTDGDGYALRGDSIPWDASLGRHPHLMEEQADRLARQVLDAYIQRTGRNPLRVVVHKTSKYDDQERSGFRHALRDVPVVELVNLLPTNFRLLRQGSYPPTRGTLCRVNGAATYLFTGGYMPEWGTYPGAHIPVPVQLQAEGATEMHRIASDILGLTRMNWNTARNTSGIPITLRFAREVGGIMAEFGADKQPHPSYRYYM